MPVNADIASNDAEIGASNLEEYNEIKITEFSVTDEENSYNRRKIYVYDRTYLIVD